MFTLGICGGSGSGKSTLVERLLADELGQNMAHLPHDAYYRNLADMPDEVRLAHNWDHPAALETDLFLQHLAELKAGQTIERPVYNFDQHRRSLRTIPVPARRVLIVDGILILALPEVRDQLDLKVYVDTPADLRLLRRVLRDVQERGRSVDDIAQQYIQTVRVMHEKLVEPSKRWADVVVPWEEHNQRAVQLLRHQLTVQCQ